MTDDIKESMSAPDIDTLRELLARAVEASLAVYMEDGMLPWDKWSPEDQAGYSAMINAAIAPLAAQRIADAATIARLTAANDHKEAVIEKYKNGHVRRENMADQIARLISDRDQWRSAAQKGSKSANRKINDYRKKWLVAAAKLTAAHAALQAIADMTPISGDEFKQRHPKLNKALDDAGLERWGEAMSEFAAEFLEGKT